MPCPFSSGLSDFRALPKIAFTLIPSNRIEGWIGIDLLRTTTSSKVTTIIFRANEAGTGGTPAPAQGRIAFYSDRSDDWKRYSVSSYGSDVTLPRRRYELVGASLWGYAFWIRNIVT